MTNEPTLADALDRVKRMACNCISYNAQEWGGTDPETVLPYRKYFPYSERETVCVDACIADTMERLWSAGVRTGSCCCGHNGKSSIANGRPSVMIVDPSQAPLAFDVLAADPREWWVQFWAGAEAARNPADDQSATIARLSEQVNTLITEKHADAEAIGALRDALAEVTAERDAIRAALADERKEGV